MKYSVRHECDSHINADDNYNSLKRSGSGNAG